MLPSDTARVFVSYSRKDTPFAKRLVNSLAKDNRDVWVDWEDIPRAADWLQEIYNGIESADTFISIITQHTLESEICNFEIAHALKHNKRIVPVIRQRIEPEIEASIHELWDSANWATIAQQNWNDISHLNWLFFDDDREFDDKFRDLLETVDTDLEYLKLHTRLLVRAREWEQNARSVSFLARGDELLIAKNWLDGADRKKPLATTLHHEFITISTKYDEERKAEANRIAAQIRLFQRTSIVLAIVFFLAIIAGTFAGILAFTAQRQGNIASTRIAELADIVPGATRGARWNNWAQNLDITTRLELLQSGYPESIWIPVENRFNCDQGYCVEMLFVPAGCFQMGSTLEDDPDEQPVHRVCIEDDYWIDRYEVSNAQFQAIYAGFQIENEADWEHPLQPRTSVNWFEAQSYCEFRGGKLPDESQWEYAAAGPNNLVYPWGNEFDDTQVAFGYPLGEVATVDSYPGGISWVGAFNMSGNVWEWVTTIRADYPYNPGDGRENLDTNASRVIRGGSFRYTPSRLRNANRGWALQTYSDIDLGFRCVLSATNQEE